MGLEEVKQEILDKGENEVKKSETDTLKEIKAMRQKAEELIREKKKEKAKELEFHKEHFKQKKEAEANAEARYLILEKKRGLIEKAIAEAKKRLKKNEKRYLNELLAKAQKEIDVERIYCNQQLKGVNTIVKDINGLIAENNDGSISIDLSFDTLLSRIKDAYLKEISEVLFR